MKYLGLFLMICVIVNLQACSNEEQDRLPIENEQTSKKYENNQQTTILNNVQNEETLESDTTRETDKTIEDIQNELEQEAASKYQEQMSNMYSDYLDDYLDATKGVDFSKYESHGHFNEGLAWVCESDYIGKKYSYINESGEIAFELQENVSTCYDCQNGVAIVVYKNKGVNQSVVLYNKTGLVVAEIKDGSASLPTLKYFNNGNIFIRYAGERYMYINCEDSYITRAEAGLSENCADYSEGLLYSGDCFSTTAAVGCYVYFFDEYGNVAINLSRETGEYYKNVYSATDFENGKSKIIFMGLDNKRYAVEIDTEGNWLGEPKRVDDDFRVR